MDLAHSNDFLYFERSSYAPYGLTKCTNKKLISFLKEKLSLDTLAALSQDGEKLMISKALRNAPSALQAQLDQAIRIVVGQRALAMQAGLTHQDYFYQKISQIDQIMATFCSLVQNSITNSKDRVGKVS